MARVKLSSAVQLGELMATHERARSKAPWVDLAFVVGLFGGIAVVLLRNQLLPTKFFADGLKIQGLAQGRLSAVGDKSFDTVAYIYKILGLANNDTIASLFGFGLFAVCAAAMFARARLQTQQGVDAFVLFAVMILGAIYLGYYSKDIVVIAIVALVLASRRSLRSDFLIVGAMLAYAALFRQYWYLTATLFIVFRIAQRRGRGLAGLLALSGIALIVLGAAIYTILGLDPDYFRTSVNAGRIDAPDAQSAIKPFVSIGQPLGGIVNLLITYASLIIPAPLALMGGIYYITLSAAVCFLWITFFRSCRTLLRTRFRDSDAESRTTRAIALVMSFLATQALFEPDYGSALRHATPILLLVVLLSSTARAARGRRSPSALESTP